MSKIASRLQTLGLALPPPMQPPPGVVLPFAFVRVVGPRAHLRPRPAERRRVFAQPLGKVGRELTRRAGLRRRAADRAVDPGQPAASLGDLDRIAAWGRVFGMVNSAPGFNRQPSVINGFSDLILELFGPEVGAHSRSAVGMAELPFDIPVEIEGEVTLRS